MGRRPTAWLDSGRRNCVRWRDPGTGKVQRRTFSSLKAARAFQRGKLAELDRARSDGLLPITLAEAVEEFAAHIGRLRPNTQRDMAYVLEAFEGFVGPTTRVSSVGPGPIDRYLSSITSSESTAAKHFGYLRRFFRWALTRGYCPGDPTRGCTVRPVATSRDIGPLPSDADIQRLLDCIPDERLKLATLLGLTTGLDRSVIANLKASQVDLENAVIVTTRPKTSRRGGREFAVPIHVSLLPAVADAISEAGVLLPFGRYAWRGWYRLAREKAGPPWTHIRVGDFRKIASGRAQRVMPLAAVSKMLGHSQITTTVAHYSPPDPATRQAFDALPLPSLRPAAPTTRRKPA